MFTRYLLLLVLAFNAIAAPVLLSSRQNKDGTTTLMTVTNTLTPGGTVTENCVITLTPIKDKDGKDAFEEVRKCTISVNGQNNGSNGNGSSDSSSESSSDSSETTSSDSSQTTSTDSSQSTSTTASDSTPTSSSVSASATASNSAVIVNGVSTIKSEDVSTFTGSTTTSGAATTTSASSDAATTTTSSSSVAATTTTSSSSDAATTSASDSTSAAPTTSQTSAADQQGSAAQSEATPTAAGAFAVPGKNVSVLPIGLGVFAGISVIALIVVGLVTWERTKYRRAFRERKLAESGAAMGYGGMAQR